MVKNIYVCFQISGVLVILQDSYHYTWVSTAHPAWSTEEGSHMRGCKCPSSKRTLNPTFDTWCCVQCHPCVWIKIPLPMTPPGFEAQGLTCAPVCPCSGICPPHRMKKFSLLTGFSFVVTCPFTVCLQEEPGSILYIAHPCRQWKTTHRCPPPS